MKKLLAGIILFFISSCDYFQLQENKEEREKPIATVYKAKLYKRDIQDLFPKNTSSRDSIVLAKSLIEDWAVKQLLLKKAEENSTKEENESVDKLVRNYRESLLINNYKEKLVKQQLDTLVPVEEIRTYYNENQQNFRLNEELIKIKYLHFGIDVVDKEEIIRLFKSDSIEDIEALESRQLSFKSFHLNDSTWVSLDNVLLKIPYSKEKLLKKSKFNQKENALGLYLVAVKDVLRRNDTAPMSYISSTIKQLILHKRKLELIREREKIIVKDAVQNETFKIY